ncbi:hypothetical protein V5799_004214 [Amblyomma americanum]|uniref:C2H2-type domain-containing protein n=1 Tax=Amblyomma americanum TaxID=6943 RepID=A0AAQ4D6R4_AMBAM
MEIALAVPWRDYCNGKPSKTMPGMRFFQCHKCRKREVTLRSLFRHFHAAHGHERNWLCGLQGPSEHMEHTGNMCQGIIWTAWTASVIRILGYTCKQG